MIGLLIIVFVLFLVTAFPGAAWVANKRHVRAAIPAEALHLVTPFLVWLALAFTWQNDKTLSNIAAEPLIVGLASSIFSFLRVPLSSKVGARRAAIFSVVATTTIAVATWALVPLLSE